MARTIDRLQGIADEGFHKKTAVIFAHQLNFLEEDYETLLIAVREMYEETGYCHVCGEREKHMRECLLNEGGS